MSTTYAVMAYNEFDPTRERGERFFRSFSAAQQHPGIDEVLVVDDGSDDYTWLQERVSQIPSVKLYHNEKNLGVFLNKIEIIARATGDWVITCDSDNFKNAPHIDKALSLQQDPDVWYCPSFARPAFDYRRFIGEYNLGDISRFDQGGYKERNVARCCLNTGNQMVHRETFMEVFGQYRGTDYWLDMWRFLWDVNVHERSKHYWRQVWDANDSMLFNMLWLEAGKRLQVVDQLEYTHFLAKTDSSNYNRSPHEKGIVGLALWDELMEKSEACHNKPAVEDSKDCNNEPNDKEQE